MGFELEWYKEGHVLIGVFTDPVTDDESVVFNNTMIEMFESSSNVLVHGIFDFSQTTSMFSVKAMSQFTFPKHPRMGWNVFVGLDNKHVKFLIALATQLFKARMRQLNTMEEAFEFVKWIDQTVAED